MAHRLPTRLAFALACGVTGTAHGIEPLPRVELGVGAGALATPAYRGSGEYSALALPFPYFVYRGEQLKVTREGMRLEALGWANVTVGISAAGAWPGNDGRDPSREGMPGIDPTLELGPSLDWNVLTPDMSLCICIPVRFVTATDFSRWRSAGWVTHPHLRVLRYVDAGARTWTIGGSLGPVFADARNHAYFYDVEGEHMTPDRPPFRSGGGYSGLRGSFILGVRSGPWIFGLGLVADSLEGAVFEDSPLVSTHRSATIAFGLTYRLWQEGTSSVRDDSL